MGLYIFKILVTTFEQSNQINPVQAFVIELIFIISNLCRKSNYHIVLLNLTLYKKIYLEKCPHCKLEEIPLGLKMYPKVSPL